MADYRAYLIDRNDRVILRKDMSRRTTKPRWKPPGFMPMASTSRYGITPAKWDESAKSKSHCRVPRADSGPFDRAAMQNGFS